jgi:hypothetical protein
MDILSESRIDSRWPQDRLDELKRLSAQKIQTLKSLQR